MRVLRERLIRGAMMATLREGNFEGDLILILRWESKLAKNLYRRGCRVNSDNDLQPFQHICQSWRKGWAVKPCQML